MALAAAYVVALQLVLLPLAVAAGNSLASPLCSEIAESRANPAVPNPVHSTTGCACASGCGVQCCAPALLSPPSAAVAIDRTPLVVLAPKAIAAIPGFVSWHGPQNPRAPPSPTI